MSKPCLVTIKELHEFFKVSYSGMWKTVHELSDNGKIRVYHPSPRTPRYDLNEILAIFKG